MRLLDDSSQAWISLVSTPLLRSQDSGVVWCAGAWPGIPGMGRPLYVLGLRGEVTPAEEEDAE